MVLGPSDAICQMQIGIVLVTGIYLALRGDVTVGMLTVFMTYVTQLIWPIREWEEYWAIWVKRM